MEVVALKERQAQPLSQYLAHAGLTKPGNPHQNDESGVHYPPTLITFSTKISRLTNANRPRMIDSQNGLYPGEDVTAEYILNGKTASKDQVLSHFHCGDIDKLPIPTRDKLVLGFVSDEPDLNLLDIGCYVGILSAYLNRHAPNANVTAVDYFHDNIRMAKLIFPHLSQQFSVQSVYELKFADGSFDFVTFKEVIEHIDKPVEAIREINRVLRKGGYLFLSTPNGLAKPWLAGMNSIRTRLFTLMGRKSLIKPAIFHQGLEFSRHIYSWIPRTLYTLLVLNGFQLVQQGFIGKGLVTKLFPDFSNEMYFLVRKVHNAPTKFI